MSRLICESCDHGYAPTLPTCPWCGCTANLAHTTHTTSVMDTELTVDYWLCMFDTGEVYQLAPDHPLDITGLRRTLSQHTVITFNGLGYDLPIIALALAGADNATLKKANDQMIVQQVKSWDLLRMYNVQPLDWVDHIDMMPVKPGDGGLKMLMGKMHARKLQDLPFDPDARFGWNDRVMTREYCGNDLEGTRMLFDTFQSQIKLREDMSAEYGLDLRSKSDAQIAEAVMKSLLPFKVERPYIPAGTQFYYRQPEWLTFQTPYMQSIAARIASYPFYVTDTGGVAPAHDNHLADWGDKAVRLDIHGKWVMRPDGWEPELVTIGGMSYAMGTGGLHSTESKITHRASTTHSLRMPDVAAYYPSLIVRCGIFPQQIGPAFQTIYSGWKTRRDAAKRAKDKKTANSLKTLNNGTFGKLGSEWSIFYAPSEMIQVTITGQLGLLMLIEMLEMCGISVVSANTDGIVIHTERTNDALADNIIRWWEGVTGFTMEIAEYNLLACRDVNSYIGLPVDDTPKLKGAFAPPDPGASGWPNPTGQICVDAVVAYLQHGTPLRDTIVACQDVRQFVYVRQVKGGGSYLACAPLPRATTLTAMRRALQEHGSPVSSMGVSNDTLRELYATLRDRVMASADYLGKAVRWYYATGSAGCILTPAGGLVARTEGCKPLMELPDELPGDVDIEWYVAEAVSLLVDIGVDMPPV